ncbi:MAG TPA: CRISPR-associated endoribonuclease Cas6 [Prolixibacteraceae bacterium]|nr:CRISPR-associated endoribonuclease Cas6 [Prolixibacteraceae bacterium]
MRFKISFNRTGKQRMLPMDYQYYLGAWIYKVIGKADPGFATFLHEQGYADGNKNFKLFGYSPLNFGKPILWKEKSLFEINANTLTIEVGFYIPDAAERFIVGLFTQQEVFVGDRFNGIDLTVSQVERLPDPTITETQQYRALSPVVVSIMPEGEKYARYLAPTDEDYTMLLKNNLVQKLKTIPNTPVLPINFEFDFELKGSSKSKLATMKPGTAQQSKVRGYVFDFELKAPLEIHRLIVSSGIGEKNSTGFGWVEGVK